MTPWTSSASAPRADEPPWRLHARPSRERPAAGAGDSSGGAAAGRSSLALARGRDGLTYVPARLDRDAPAPLIFVSHGANDGVLPIESCSRRIVPRLERQGFTVRYEEFADGHAVPSTIAAAAVAWMLASPRPKQVPNE